MYETNAPPKESSFHAVSRPASPVDKLTGIVWLVSHDVAELMLMPPGGSATAVNFGLSVQMLVNDPFRIGHTPVTACAVLSTWKGLSSTTSTVQPATHATATRATPSRFMLFSSVP